VSTGNDLGRVANSSVFRHRSSAAAGIDEWAHVPCDPIPRELAGRAAAAGVQVVGTLDTLSHCAGLAANAALLAEAREYGCSTAPT
jgi:hypothetical protein